MKLEAQAKRLRVYLGEQAHSDGRPLWRAILEQARRTHVSGATVFKGLAGYGAHSRIKTSNILALSEDLPLVVEIVDAPDKLEPFLEWLDSVLAEGLVTVEDVSVRAYRDGKRI